jgi:hypothetical protein
MIIRNCEWTRKLETHELKYKDNIKMDTVFLDVTPCGSFKNWRFCRTWGLHHQGDKNRRSRNNVSHN